jgi:multicomponent Na+:H+ antiporter subunit C
MGYPPEQMADPVPQALMITAIVIGVSVVAMCLAMYMRVAYRYRTADWSILTRRLEK